MPEPQIPEKLGRYEVIRELGKGAMGIVYEGLDPNIGRRVAIKTARRDVIAASGMADELMERFLREARAAGGLNHPNIITIYDADEEGGTAYIAMEYLEGGDLEDLINQKQRFDPPKVAEIGATISRGLAHAHQQGIVHRDVKPANIMVLPDETIKIADFGIARVSDSCLTPTGSMIGTPHYMSPEQFMAQRVDGRSDLFSVGIIIYELLTGEKPFPGEALSAVMQKVLKTDPIPPRELNFAVSECLSQVVMKALSKDPSRRYQDGNAMAAALLESVKENPDPVVTGLGAAPAVSGEATVLSKGGADGTVLAPERGDAAVVPEAPDGAIASPRPAPDTVPGKPPFAPEAPGAPAVPKFKLSRKVLIGLASLVVVAGVATAVAVFGPEKPYYASLRLEVYLTDKLEDAVGIVNVSDTVKYAKGDPEVFIEYAPGDVEEAGKVAKPLSSKKVPLRRGTRAFKVRVIQAGYEPWEWEFNTPEKPGDIAERMTGGLKGEVILYRR